MIPFATLLLRSYYEAIGWNEDNLYSNITRSSAALLDFPVPDSLILQLANAPTPLFHTSTALDALPQLNGSTSYLTTSEPLWRIRPSAYIAFHEVVERFRVPAVPVRPAAKDEVWLAGKLISGGPATQWGWGSGGRDYLLYSRLHLPTMHLSGLATCRLSPTLQAHVAFVHQPTTPRPVGALAAAHGRGGGSDQPANPAPPPQQQPGNVLVSLQHDTGRYSGEYTYSAADSMFGVRGLYNFGWHDGPSPPTAGAGTGPTAAEVVRGGRRIDEEEMMDGGLKGRLSAGGEVYLSVKQKSFGISTGVRFTTLPSTPTAPSPSPPTTITVLYNPLIGFLSTAYAAQVGPTVSLATRFGVNVYSYESDFAIGGEWWIGRRRAKPATGTGVGGGAEQALVEITPEAREALERRKQIGGSLREEDGDGEEDMPSADPAEAPSPASVLSHPSIANPDHPDHPDYHGRQADSRLTETDRDGVLKARLSGNWSIALLYECRIRKCLVSFGLISDVLSGMSGKAIRSVGLEVQYYS